MIQEFRKTQPRSHEITSVNLIEPGFFNLDNGIPVYTIDAGTEDLIKLDLIFNAGSFFQSQPLLASLSNKCLQEGTTSYSAKAIAKTVDFYGAHLRHATDKDDARLTLYCLGRYFDKLLPLLSEVALQPVFPKEEVNTIIEKSRQEFVVNMEKVKYVARMHFNGLIFGENHPYATPVGEKHFDILNPYFLADFHKKHYAHMPFKIIVSGKLPGDIEDKINHYFGRHVVSNEYFEVAVPEPVKSDISEHLILKENTLQSAIRIGKILFNKHNPDYLKMKVVNTVLGGYFGSRLMTNIREDKGYTYGIGSMLTSMIHAGYFGIASEVGTDVREKAVIEIFSEIKKLRTDLVPDEELKLVKNYLLGSFLRSADGPFALSELVKSATDFGFGLDYYNGFLETVKSITAKEIRDLAVKYLDPATMTTLVVGK
ncbi:MAG: insulinase family protein [Bacteroidales bacterium]|nr:insulinase family protein [Bacteroidales bacterium]